MKPNIYWYKYSLSESEKNTLAKSEVGQEVLRLHKDCADKTTTIKMLRYVSSVVLGIVSYLLLFLLGLEQLEFWSDVTISVSISIIFFALSDVVFAEEKHPDVKSAGNTIWNLAHKQGNTQIGTIIQRMITCGSL